MKITSEQINSMKEYLKSKEPSLEKYATGFVRLSRMEEEFNYLDTYKKDLKNLYKIKRLIKDSNLMFSKDFLRDLENQIDKNLEALTTLAYMKRKDWDKVGICGDCFGSLYVGSSDPMAHCYDTERCDCYYGYVDGFQLKNSVSRWVLKEYRDRGWKYDHKLALTKVMLDYLKDYKG